MAVAVDAVTRRGARKAAVLLVALGGDLAAPLLKKLGDEQVEAITREIVAMEELSDRERLDVFERCHRELTSRREPGGVSGQEFARDLLARGLGTKKAQDVLARVGNPTKGEAFDFVRNTEIPQIVAYFEGEHPQTIALALGHMPPELASQILAGLSFELQGEVAVRLARTAKTDPEVVRGVEQAMRRQLQFFTNQGFSSAGGMDYLVQVLSACDSRSEREIIAAVQETDPALAQELRDMMFTFQDLPRLDDRSIQRVLREVDPRDLAVAMRGASDEVRARVFRNLSSRAGQALREDMERFGPVRLRVVEEAQAKVVAVARRLHDEEEIVVPRGRQDVFV